MGLSCAKLSTITFWALMEFNPGGFFNPIKSGGDTAALQAGDTAALQYRLAKKIS